MNKQSNLDPTAYMGVSHFKSIRRAIRRGNMSKDGTIVPKRPFNNRGNSSKRRDIHSRVTNELKKKIYGEVKEYFKRVG